MKMKYYKKRKSNNKLKNKWIKKILKDWNKFEQKMEINLKDYQV